MMELAWTSVLAFSENFQAHEAYSTLYIKNNSGLTIMDHGLQQTNGNDACGACIQHGFH